MTSPDSCPVVRIVAPVTKGNPHGFTEINETDFDPEKHTLFEGEFVEPVAVEEVVVEDETIDPLEDADGSKAWGAPSVEE